MKTNLFYIFIALSLGLLSACSSSSDTKKIGIIVPLEHKAMNEIVAGFTGTLQQNYNKKVSFKVANAQGDANLQRAIITQMRNEKYDVIVPIGTSTTQMTNSMIHDQPIVSLASSITELDRKKLRTNCNITAVHDEISTSQLIQFIHQVYPAATTVTLIHSASDKVFPDVKEAIAAGNKLQMNIKPMMVNALPDLYTIANTIPDNTEIILVLKDSLIVSGIATLEKIAEKRQIPLITSDQGSVQDGASLALGVHEKQIGEEGAKLALKVLNGQPPCSIPMTDMTKLTVFVNQSSLIKQHQSLEPIKEATASLHHTIEYVDNKKESTT